MANKFWVGGNLVVPNSWYGIGNWGALVGTPTSADGAIIDGVGTPYVEIASAGAVANLVQVSRGNQLVVDGTGTLNVGTYIEVGGFGGNSLLMISGNNASVTTTDALIGYFGGGGTGLLDVVGGTFTATSNLRISGLLNGSSGTLRIESGGVVNAGATFVGIAGVGAVDGKIEFLGGGGFLNTANVTLNTAGSTIDFNTSVNDSFSAAIHGLGKVRVFGSTSAVITLTGVSDYTGGTDISSGTVSINNASALGTGTISLLGTNEKLRTAATMTLNNTINQVVGADGVIAAATGTTLTLTGQVNVLGAAGHTLHLGSATDTGKIIFDVSGGLGFAGATAIAIDGGTLAASGNNNNLSFMLNSPIGSVSIASGAALDVNGRPIFKISNLTGAGNIINTGASATSLTISDIGLKVFSGTISDVGGGLVSLTIAGGGTANLTNVQNYHGSTTVTLGSELRLGTNDAIANSSALTVNGTLGLGTANQTVSALSGSGVVTTTGSGGNLTVTGSVSTTFSGVISNVFGPLSLTKTGSGTLTLSGVNTFFGGTTINGGTLALTGGQALDNFAGVQVNAPGTLQLLQSETIGWVAGSGAINLGASTLTVGGANVNTAFSGAISEAGGAGNLTKVGTGTLSLSGANTYTGTTTLTAGALNFATSGSLFDTGDLVVNGGTLGLDNAILSVDSLSGIGGAIALTAVNGASALSFGSDGSTMSYSGNISIAGLTELVKEGTGTTTLSGVISGGGAVTIDNGTLLLSGANTYSGQTTINAGTTLKGGVMNAFSSSSAINIAATGTLDVGGFGQTIGALSGSGVVTNSGAVSGGLLESNAGATTFSGVIKDGLTASMIFQKTGVGTLTLSGVNTYSGATAIFQGTLALSGAGSIANSSSVSLSSGTVLDISGTTSGATVKDIYTTAVGTVNMGGKALTVTGQAGGIGSMFFNGGAGTDALSITFASSLADFSLADVSFTNWTAGTDTITVNGNGLNNIITGSAQRDTLNGGLGADTLDGRGGNDFIFGGDGDDTIVFNTGLLAANVQGGNNTDTLLVNDGTLPISFNLVTAGIEKAVWLQHDLANNQSFSLITHNYDTQWRLLSSVTNYDDNTRIETFYDVANAQNYQNVRNDYNASNQRTATYYLLDNGTTSNSFFDVGNTQNYQFTRADYDTLSRLTYSSYLLDNGVTSQTYYDAANAAAWTSSRSDLNAGGSITFARTYYDNGTREDVSYDADNVLNYQYVRQLFDAANRLTYNSYQMDNGTISQIYYDAANTGAWASSRSDVDTLGRTTFTSTTNDDNTRMDVYYDVTNQYAWNTLTYYYDASLNLINTVYG